MSSLSLCSSTFVWLITLCEIWHKKYYSFLLITFLVCIWWCLDRQSYMNVLITAADYTIADFLSEARNNEAQRVRMKHCASWLCQWLAPGRNEPQRDWCNMDPNECLIRMKWGITEVCNWLCTSWRFTHVWESWMCLMPKWMPSHCLKGHEKMMHRMQCIIQIIDRYRRGTLSETSKESDLGALKDLYAFTLPSLRSWCWNARKTHELSFKHLHVMPQSDYVTQWTADDIPGNCHGETAHETITWNPMSLLHIPITAKYAVTWGKRFHDVNITILP